MDLIFNHLKTVLISIHRPSISKKIKTAIENVEILEREKVEKRKERNMQNLEFIRMQYEERLSRKHEKTMKVQTRRILQQQKQR